VEGALVGGLSFLAALYYPEQLAPIRRGHDRVNRLRRERCLQQSASPRNCLSTNASEEEGDTGKSL